MTPGFLSLSWAGDQSLGHLKKVSFCLSDMYSLMYLTNKSPLHEARKELNSTLAYELVLERQTIQSMNKENSLI